MTKFKAKFCGVFSPLFTSVEGIVLNECKDQTKILANVKHKKFIPTRKTRNCYKRNEKKS